MLNFEVESANQHLDGVIWKMDTAKNFDTFATNKNGLERGLLFQQNESVDLVGRLHVDMFNTPKYLLNNIDFGLTLELNQPNFYLIRKDANKSELTIEDATLYMEHLVINPEVLLAHQSILEQKNAVYPYKRCEIKNFTLAQHVNSFQLDNVCTGLLPELCIVFMVENAAYQGMDGTKNPFNLQHFNLSSFEASVNGLSLHPRSLEFDFTQKNPRSQLAYFNLFKQLNLHRFDRANQISRELYNNGCFMICFDLSPDHEATDCSSITNSGTLRFEGKFSKQLDQAITVLVYLQYDAELYVDKDRRIFPATF